MLKKGSRKPNVRYELRKEERRNESGQHRKKGWREKVNRTEQSKKIDKELGNEISEMKRNLEIDNERESKMNVIGNSLILH